MEHHKDILIWFTKQEIINYLNVKDRLTDVKIVWQYPVKINYIEIILYILPFILVFILILILYLVYKQYKAYDKRII